MPEGDRVHGRFRFVVVRSMRPARPTRPTWHIALASACARWAAGERRYLVVECLVDCHGTLLPVAGRANPRFVDATVRAQVMTHGAHRRGFAGGPHVAFTVVRQIDVADCLQQRIAAMIRCAAIAPHQMQLGLRREFDSRRRIGHFDHRGDARPSRQFFEAARDGWQRGIVADQQMPVEPGGDHQRAARAADAKVLADFGLGRPICGGTRLVHREFDVEFARLAIEAARREIACGRTRLAGRKHRAVRAGLRQRWFVRAGLGEKHFDVVVERSGDEVVQIVAGEGHADQVRGQRADLLDLQQAEFQRMPYAMYGQVGAIIGSNIFGQHEGVIPVGFDWRGGARDRRLRAGARKRMGGLTAWTQA
ncbi:conserved hypothetical protein [Paraburkholderia ribeironis]|uniref:Uncharacterized protein n=1 Tax=Paraburkholderia ribeironis TaxID=1247936 RepID=A0A1N7SME8_9BURK|nr:conserved hypothetical protein [Paraburkholderia ribeironis]